MKALFWIGVLVAALGLASLVVPIPHTEHQSFSAGDFKMGVETRHSETVSPVISAVMIAGGIGMMIAGKFGR